MDQALAGPIAVKGVHVYRHNVDPSASYAGLADLRSRRTKTMATPATTNAPIAPANTVDNGADPRNGMV